MQKVKTTVQLIDEIRKMCYFGTLWACPDMPDHAHQNYENQSVPLMKLYPHAKNQADISCRSGDI